MAIRFVVVIMPALGKEQDREPDRVWSGPGEREHCQYSRIG